MEERMTDKIKDGTEEGFVYHSVEANATYVGRGTELRRVWEMPLPPGDEVKKLRDRNGVEYVREESKWTSAPERPGNGWYFEELLVARGPLTDAGEVPHGE
jgi:hypothetical protein